MEAGAGKLSAETRSRKGPYDRSTLNELFYTPKNPEIKSPQ